MALQSLARSRSRHRHPLAVGAADAERRQQASERATAAARLLRLLELLLVEDAREQQSPLGPARGDVDEPPRLLGLGVTGLLAERLVALGVDRLRRRAGQAQPDPRRGRSLAGDGGDLLGVEGEPQLRGLPAVDQRAAEVGDGDRLELEPLGGVDRHHPDPGVVLAGGGRLALAVGEGRPCGRVVEEAAQVAAVVRLVLGRDPDELAQVRRPPPPLVHEQRREVVVEGLQRALDQRVQGQRRRARAEPAQAGVEAGQPLAVELRDARLPLVPALPARELVLVGRVVLGLRLLPPEQQLERRPQV